MCPDLTALSEVLTLRGKHQEAALRLRRCYQILEALYGPDDVQLLDPASALADALIATRRCAHLTPTVCELSLGGNEEVRNCPAHLYPEHAPAVLSYLLRHL